MTTLHLFLFGGVRADYGDPSRQLKLPRSAQLVLSFLLLQPRRPCPRDLLADIVWGERSEESAQGCLNTALWRLRRVLEPDGVPKGAYLHTTSTGEVGFNWDSDHWLDLSAFQNHAERLVRLHPEKLAREDVAQLESALSLYSGELLEGIYDDWALRERERLRILHLDALRLLMSYYKLQGDHQKGLAYGAEILRLDPIREDIHRDMMRLYHTSGQRAQALRQYELCRVVLDQELGIPPMEETRRVHQEVLADDSEPAVERPSTSSGKALLEAAASLRRAMARFCEAEDALQEAIRVLSASNQ